MQMGNPRPHKGDGLMEGLGHALGVGLVAAVIWGTQLWDEYGNKRRSERNKVADRRFAETWRRAWGARDPKCPTSPPRHTGKKQESGYMDNM